MTEISFWRVCGAFIERDLKIAVSYRFAFLMRFGDLIAFTIGWYFFSRMFEGLAIPQLDAYGGELFPFIIIGIAFFSFQTLAVKGFAQSIRSGQMAGTLEAMLATPTRTPVILFASILWELIFTAIKVCIWIIFAFVLFVPVDLVSANLLGAVLALALMVLSTSAIGIVSASFVIVFKEGDPIGRVFNLVSMFLGGVYFPIQALPQWLRYFSYLLPTTYALQALREAILLQHPVASYQHELIALALFAAIALPISLLLFRAALRKAKRDGSLTKY